MKKDSNIANKIEHLENNLIKRANFAHNFKNLFIYYLYWYNKNLKSTILTVLLCLIIIFGIIIPLERNFTFYKDVSNETLLKAATMISWTAEYFYHLIVIFLLYFFSKIKNFP